MLGDILGRVHRHVRLPAATGTYLLTFSSVLNNLQTPQGSGYSTDGTLTATLNFVSGTGATGTVTLTATF